METGKKKTLLVWLFCLMLVAVPALWAPGTALARGHHDGGHGKGDFHGPLHMLKKLDLTDAQKRDVAGILKENRDQAKNLVTQMAESREKLFALVGSPDYNEAAIRQASQESAKLHEELIVLRAQIGQKIRAILTPDQQAKLDAMKAKFGGRMQEHIDHGFDHLDQWIDKHSN